jgi:hypothetical protein
LPIGVTRSTPKPMTLPHTMLSTAPGPPMSMPSMPFPAMTFPAAGSAPPMTVALAPRIQMPVEEFRSSAVPLTSVPTRFPSITLPTAALPWT